MSNVYGIKRKGKGVKLNQVGIALYTFQIQKLAPHSTLSTATTILPHSLPFTSDRPTFSQQNCPFQGIPIAIARDIGDRYGEGNALGNLGNIYCALGRYEEAIHSQEEFLAIAHAIGMHRGEGNALGNLGHVYRSSGNRSRGDYEKAIEYFQGSLAIAREVGQRREEGIVLVNWGATLVQLEQYSEAQHHLQPALSIFQALGEQCGEAEANYHLALLHQKIGEMDAA